jgi:Arylsulfotransferase (ASST)
MDEQQPGAADRSRTRRVAIVAVVIALASMVAAPVGAMAILGKGPWAEPRLVSTYPSPGSHTVAPGAQIVFRGVAVQHLRVTTQGSSSGLHRGTVRPHSDGKGGSFLPDKPFTAGETVTVSTNQKVHGATAGRFQFKVATPAGAIPAAPLPPAERTDGDVQRFRSAPGLAPASVTMNRSADGTSDDRIFLAPQQGPVQNGPMILDQNGQLVWFKPLSDGLEAADFRVQRYKEQPVLTWWQGHVGAGVGSGENVIIDSAYRQIATVRAANGLSADLHEFKLTPRGTALITAYYPVYADASSVHGSARQVVLDSVVQEIDVKTGLLLFQWDSLDHVPMTDAHTETPKQAGSPLDYFHVNSVEEDRDGNLVISARNTWAAYKVTRQTGHIMWTLGGKHSSFTMGPGTSFAFQHDVRVRADDDAVLTLFDNGGGPPRVKDQSRGLALALDLKHMTATRTDEYRHTSALPANFEGNVQQLPGGNVFLGRGQQPYFGEFDASGQAILDGRFVSNTANYRAYTFPWKATPSTPPAVGASYRSGHAAVYVSWNGATEVAAWRILAGDAPTSLDPIMTSEKRGFETKVEIGAHRYVAVQALDRSGHPLATSATVQSG